MSTQTAESLWRSAHAGHNIAGVSDLFEPEVLASLLRQWSRILRARNRSPRTIETYTALQRWCKWLAACKGTGFPERRDTAIIRLFLDTGMRLGELTGLDVGNLDMELEVATVLGKGRRTRSCPFGANTGQALDRYLRARARHRDARLDAA